MKDILRNDPDETVHTFSQATFLTVSMEKFVPKILGSLKGIHHFILGFSM